MSLTEGVKFWLDNKSVAGIRVANIADQVLVDYRSRFYLVADGAAVMKGGKPLRYSQTTLPAEWRKILKDDAVTTAAAVTPTAVPAGEAKRSRTRKARVDPGSEEITMPETIAPAVPMNEAPEKPHKAARKAAVKAVDKPAAVLAVNPPAQTSVSVDCPYCKQQQDLPVEKGRSGKPFFHSCLKCREEFAVRFKQVTIYRAQVAGFR